MQQGESPEYGEAMVEALELIWGEGFLSPGGSAEVDRVLGGLSLKGASVLDIGCGVGGIDLLLAERHGARSVLGIDVEAANILRAKDSAERRGLSGLVRFQAVDPGPLPLPSAAFDLVFSKDALIHIPDKESLFVDIWRVLRPGGWFAASDWLRVDDNPPSPAMEHYIESEGLSFAMASADRYRRAMAAAGFADIHSEDRNAWYAETARAELAAMDGPLKARLTALVGKEETEREREIWQRMLVVLDSGELRPTHLRGRRPA